MCETGLRLFPVILAGNDFAFFIIGGTLESVPSEDHLPPADEY